MGVTAHGIFILRCTLFVRIARICMKNPHEKYFYKNFKKVFFLRRAKSKNCDLNEWLIIYPCLSWPKCHLRQTDIDTHSETELPSRVRARVRAARLG